MGNPRLEIIDFSTEKSDAILPILAASNFKPLRFLLGIDDTDLLGFWSLTIRELMQNPRVIGYLAIRGDEVSGVLICSDNPWETELLGKSAAVINGLIVDYSSADREKTVQSLLDHLLIKAKARGIHFIHCKVYTNDLVTIHALESSGFRLMDTVVDCVYDYRHLPIASTKPPVLGEEVTLRLATPADRHELVDVAAAAFKRHFGRFHSDEKISPDLAGKAYEQWICSSLDGYADWIHVAIVGGRMAGFSIWKKPSILEQQLKTRVGHYSIAGIHPVFQGRGLFSALTYAGMKSLDGLVDVIEGPTHVNNYGVQVAYSKLGWRVLCDARHSFHKWME